MRKLFALAAAAAGMAPALAWTILFAAALLPALPLILGRRSAGHWSGYAILAVMSTMFVVWIDPSASVHEGFQKVDSS